jgi:hypothetical protein
MREEVLSYNFKEGVKVLTGGKVGIPQRRFDNSKISKNTLFVSG